MATKKAEPSTETTVPATSWAESATLGKPVGGGDEPMSHEETIEAMAQAVQELGGAPLGRGTSKESLRGRPVAS